jgi:hypothetical protein
VAPWNVFVVQKLEFGVLKQGRRLSRLKSPNLSLNSISKMIAFYAKSVESLVRTSEVASYTKQYAAKEPRPRIARRHSRYGKSEAVARGDD